MPSVCFYFQVHQPYRLRAFDCFKIGRNHSYEDDEANQRILQRVAAKCYLPMNHLLIKLIRQFNGRFKVAFSISGAALDQMEQFSPETLTSFQELMDTGCVELLGETYYHSLSYLYSKNEFSRQIEQHKKKIKALFDYQPVTFRNTELIYNNDLGNDLAQLGYSGVVTEGLDRILGYRSPGFLYHPPGNQTIKCILKNYRLSDDIAFRFSQQSWAEWPLTAPKFSHWIHRMAGNGDTVNLFMDYETFGEHQWQESGIFEFMRALPEQILRHPDFDFKTPREVVETYPVRGEYDVHEFSSWADEERDLSAWLGNPLQHDAVERVYALEKIIKNTGDPSLLNTWSRLLTSDHFYYMCTKFWNDGDVHKYFSPYPTPYEAYINYMNVLTDLEHVLETKYEVSFR